MFHFRVSKALVARSACCSTLDKYSSSSCWRWCARTRSGFTPEIRQHNSFVGQKRQARGKTGLLLFVFLFATGFFGVLVPFFWPIAMYNIKTPWETTTTPPFYPQKRLWSCFIVATWSEPNIVTNVSWTKKIQKLETNKHPKKYILKKQKKQTI